MEPLQLPQRELRERAVRAVQKHWIAPRFVDGPDPVAAGRVEEVARAALDTMLTRQFRVGPLPVPEVYDQLLERVRRKVRHNLPIYVTVGYGPIKNLNAVSYSRADWAEFFALCHLVAWHNKVQAVYAPGLQIRIVFDDTTLAMANHADRRLMRSYMSSIGELTRVLSFERLFLPSFGHSSFAWLFHFGIYHVARFLVWRWERQPANREQIDRMDHFARRNVVLPPGLDPAEQEDYIRASSHRYRIYWEALQLSGVTKSKNRIIAMYLNGSQHHIPEVVSLHLTSVDKGQVTQPWQGEGALLDNGHGGLEPYVVTAGRKLRYTVQSVDGLSVLPLPGFERIAVVRSNESARTVTAKRGSESIPIILPMPRPA
jgi:hypothetical protein